MAGRRVSDRDGAVPPSLAHLRRRRGLRVGRALPHDPREPRSVHVLLRVRGGLRPAVPARALPQRCRLLSGRAALPAAEGPARLLHLRGDVMARTLLILVPLLTLA